MVVRQADALQPYGAFLTIPMRAPGPCNNSPLLKGRCWLILGLIQTGSWPKRCLNSWSCRHSPPPIFITILKPSLIKISPLLIVRMPPKTVPGTAEAEASRKSNRPQVRFVDNVIVLNNVRRIMRDRRRRKKKTPFAVAGKVKEE